MSLYRMFRTTPNIRALHYYSSTCYTGFSHWSCIPLVKDGRFLLKLLLCKAFKPLAYCMLVLISLFLQGLSDSRLEKSQSQLHFFKSTKGKECLPIMLHRGAASDRKIQTSACPVSSFITKPLIWLTLESVFLIYFKSLILSSQK